MSDPTFQADGNSGLKQRYNLIAERKLLYMIGPLHCDIFQKNKMLYDLKIKMTTSKPNFRLMSPKPDADYSHYTTCVFIYSQSESEPRYDLRTCQSFGKMQC